MRRSGPHQSLRVDNHLVASARQAQIANVGVIAVADVVAATLLLLAALH